MDFFLIAVRSCARRGGTPHVLSKRFLSECRWESIEVFALIYNLVREMIALHVMVLVGTTSEIRVAIPQYAQDAAYAHEAFKEWIAQVEDFWK
ncbi:MAG: hypothetical protein ABSE51_23990 [Terracidiphilus sp.]